MRLKQKGDFPSQSMRVRKRESDWTENSDCEVPVHSQHRHYVSPSVLCHTLKVEEVASFLYAMVNTHTLYIML